MSRSIRITLLLSLLLLISVFPSLRAWWFSDGVPVTTAPGIQKRCRLTDDGEGGAIIVWEDSTGGVDPDIANDIYAQRIDLMGTAQWGYAGTEVCDVIEHQENCQIITDFQGGAYIAWEDWRDANADIYAQRVNSDRFLHWNFQAEPVCTQSFKQSAPQLAMDWSGGVFVVWMDYRNADADIYAQRLNGGGQPEWTVDGDSICTAPGIQEGPKIVSDGLDGAIITWFDGRSGNNDIYAQKVNPAGDILWTVDGVPVCTAANEQNWPEIVSDGAGGAIISWHDGRSGLLDVYAQWIDASGVPQWAVDGVPLCTAAGDQAQTYIVSDGDGGAIVVWLDGRSFPDWGLFVQHIDASGTVQWATDGVPLSTSTLKFHTQYSAGLVSDGDGGAIAAWIDTRGGGKVYSQRVDASGTILWTTDGVLLSNANSNQELPAITSDCFGGAIIAWQDDRNGESDIYAQQIDAKGRIGYLLPDIHSVTDVYGDEGGFVQVIWDAPKTDFVTGDITEYTIWRALETPAALSMIKGDATVVSSPSEALNAAAADREDPILRLSSLNGEMLYWELMFTQAAYRLEGYAKTVPTLFDSTAVNDDYHYFQVIAHTDDPSIFYVSEPDSGYSVDDLAPCFPAGLAGTQSFAPEGLWLTWNQNTEVDFDLYNVYRDIGPSFDPGPGNLLLSTCETSTFDGGWRWDAGYCYKVTAVDIHGNESENASVCAEQVTGDDPMPLPDATFLDQNYPNPFNPSTTITFGLKEKGHVSLRIYDASGRLVATLVDETRTAGSYIVEWNGREKNASSVASGVYFYKLSSKDFEETKKMILLR